MQIQVVMRPAKDTRSGLLDLSGRLRTMLDECYGGNAPYYTSCTDAGELRVQFEPGITAAPGQAKPPIAAPQLDPLDDITPAKAFELAGFVPMFTKADPRGEQYGTMEGSAIAGRLFIRHSLDGYTIEFPSVSDFGAWARSNT